MSSLNSFNSSPFFSTKHSTYFQTYDELLSHYRGNEIVFLEVGVLEGGSLFMWRDFFGPKVRIIGVDLNPLAKKWETFGFEIFIGDQSKVEFWKSLHREIGDVDIILDDGGHTFKQQITTAMNALPMIKDGGLLIVEDTHTSYMAGYGRSTFSFMKWAYLVCDAINRRFSDLDKGSFTESPISGVWKVSFFESIVGFHVERSKAELPSLRIDNSGTRDHAVDLQADNVIPRIFQSALKPFRFLKALPFANSIYIWFVQIITAETKSLRKLFRDHTLR
jgi:hypothetical protein